MQLHVDIRRLDWASPALAALHACTECGDCEPICPSHIPLLADFSYAKAELAWQREVLARADAARRRFVARRQRLAEEANVRSRVLTAARANSFDSADAAVDLLQATLARVRKKQQTGTEPVCGG